jgi:hypothetical protein
MQCPFHTRTHYQMLDAYRYNNRLPYTRPKPQFTIQTMFAYYHSYGAEVPLHIPSIRTPSDFKNESAASSIFEQNNIINKVREGVLSFLSLSNKHIKCFNYSTEGR